MSFPSPEVLTYSFKEPTGLVELAQEVAAVIEGKCLEFGATHPYVGFFWQFPWEGLEVVEPLVPGLQFNGDEGAWEAVKEMHELDFAKLNFYAQIDSGSLFFKLEITFTQHDERAVLNLIQGLHYHFRRNLQATLYPEEKQEEGVKNRQGVPETCYVLEVSIVVGVPHQENDDFFN